LVNGWHYSSSKSLLYTYNRFISQEQKAKVSKIEIFDELEEWNLLMSHYCLTLSGKGEVFRHILQVFNVNELDESSIISPITSEIYIPKLLTPTNSPAK